MSHKVERIPNSGWILIIDKKPEYCTKCSRKLKGAFFLCRDFELAICKRCERNIVNTCPSKEPAHEHWNIEEVRLINE